MLRLAILITGWCIWADTARPGPSHRCVPEEDGFTAAKLPGKYGVVDLDKVRSLADQWSDHGAHEAEIDDSLRLAKKMFYTPHSSEAAPLSFF